MIPQHQPPVQSIQHNTDPKIGHILHMKLHSGKNLPKADTFGSIDAYAKVIIPLIVGGTATHTTKVVNNNFDPEWKFRIYQHDVDISKNIRIEVWDHDAISSSDLVCNQEIPLSGLAIPIHRREYALNPVGKFMPHRSGSPSVVVASMAIGSSLEFVADLLQQRGVAVQKDIFKKNLVFPLGFSNLAMKISMKKHVKISVLDCNVVRNLVVNFEIPGKDFRSKITFHKTPKQIKGFTVMREVKLKKAINLLKGQFPAIKLVVSPFTPVEKIKYSDITHKHGWAGVLDYKAAKKTLNNIIPDDRHESIYMIEKYFYLKCDWDSSNSDQRVGLLDPYRSQGYHIEITHSDKASSEIEYYAAPKRLLETDQYCGAISEVNDLSYPVMHSAMSIELLQKTQPLYYDLYQLAPIL